MKIVHTADLHLGQIIYQNYDRADEHAHFFRQLEQWCAAERPDALVVAGDVFDVAQPSTAARGAYIEAFVRLHECCPEMMIVIIAGNHDSASRLQVEELLWRQLNVVVVGVAPPLSVGEADCGRYIVRLPAGYIVAVPYSPGNRREAVQAVLDVVAAENTGGLPVVAVAHAAVDGVDVTGHNIDVGNLRTLPAEAFGCGYDYLALGHIHRPQTLGRPASDEGVPETVYDTPVARYAGSALHVSCDEAYPHTVSVVDIDRHGGCVSVRRLRIDELRHFHTLPREGAFRSGEAALAAVAEAVAGGLEGYFRLRMDYGSETPPDFEQKIYRLLADRGDRLCFNPKHLWVGEATGGAAVETPVFAVAELQQMNDPMIFVERTADQYKGFSLDELREAFAEIAAEANRLSREK